MGRHRAGGRWWWRRSEPLVEVAELPPLPFTVEMVDGFTGTAHQVTEQAFAAGRSVGRYLAICGRLILAASLATPPGPRCPTCAMWSS